MSLGTSTAHSFSLKTGNTRALTINTSQNVGIGTTSPGTALDVRGEISVAYNASYGLRFYNNARNNWSSIGNNVASGTAANLVFKDSTGEVMRITGGNLGIGTTAPTGKLEVQRSQVTTQFDRDCFLRLHPTATTDEGGLTNIFFGTSTTNNFGVAVGGRKGGAGDTSSTNNPEFSVRILNDAITGTEVLNINTAGNATFAGTVTAGSYFLGDDTSISLATTGAGTVFLRPNGQSTSGQMKVESSGNATFAGNVTVSGGQILTPSGVNLALNPNTGVVSVGGVIRASGTGNSYFTGNLGIGTTSPSQKLTVNSGTINSVARFESTNDTAQIIIKDDDTTMYFGAKNSVGYISPTGSTPANGICVNTSGNVGIGTATPAQKLTVGGGGAILQEGPTGGGNNTFQTWQYGTDTNYKLLLKQNVGGGIVKHIFDLTNNGTAYNNILVLDRGQVGIGTTSPSEALHVNGTIKGTKLDMDQSGSTTSDLSSPTGFIDVVVGGTAYIIPYYTPE